MHVQRAGDSPLSGTTDGAGKGSKIISDQVQRLRTIFYHKPK